MISDINHNGNSLGCIIIFVTEDFDQLLDTKFCFDHHVLTSRPVSSTFRADNFDVITENSVTHIFLLKSRDTWSGRRQDNVGYRESYYIAVGAI